MDRTLDGVAVLETDEGVARAAGGSAAAESIRLDLAHAWGEMGAAWGVTPAIARVQAYLMARQEPLTEREVREALGLSHRAASLALAEAESVRDRPGPCRSVACLRGCGGITAGGRGTHRRGRGPTGVRYRKGRIERGGERHNEQGNAPDGGDGPRKA